MSYVELLLMAIGLGFDAFSVALGVGGRWADARSRFRLCFHFGLFQFLMPIIGWRAGARILPLIGSWDHWVAFGILMVIALKMLIESFRQDDAAKESISNPTKGWPLVGLSVAVSIDALGVGFTLGKLEAGQALYAVFVGVTASAMSLIGMLLAHRATKRWGAWAERAGACILAIVAIRLLTI
jgi:putative Mn2+ efflux pump MntP